MITTVVSKYVSTAPPIWNPAGNTPGASVATTLYPYAAPTPRPISVNMFGLRCTNDCHMRSKNGQPHHNTTGVASASWMRLTRAIPRRCDSAPPVAMSPIASRKTGAPKTTPTQKRRVMSTSSGLGASVRSLALVITGSSAMPHIGQAPGRSLTTSGCMGHVYLVVGGWRLEVEGGRGWGLGRVFLEPADGQHAARAPMMASRRACRRDSALGSAVNFATQPLLQK